LLELEELVIEKIFLSRRARWLQKRLQHGDDQTCTPIDSRHFTGVKSVADCQQVAKKVELQLEYEADCKQQLTHSVNANEESGSIEVEGFAGHGKIQSETK
jgi:hypothetical protein